MAVNATSSSGSASSVANQPYTPPAAANAAHNGEVARAHGYPAASSFEPPPRNDVPTLGLRHGMTGPQVRKLQEDLIKLGYMTREQVNTGPGVFGPRTERALEAFQKKNHLAPNGRYGSDDRIALTRALNAHDAAHRAAESGSAAPRATTAAPAAATGAGRIDSANEANKYFATQWGGTKFNTVRGAPDGYSDCTPTSAVMAASSLGLIKDPTPANVEKAIDHMRDLERGHNTDYSSATSIAQAERGLRAVGAKVKRIPTSMAAIDAALKKGGRVMVAGDPWDAWGKQLSAKGQYLNHRDPGNHSCVIFGKTADGHYLLGDPLSKKGTIEVTAAQLQHYFRDGSPYALQVTK